jgi:hypothetical protein
LISDFSDHIHLKNSDAVHPQERIENKRKEFLPRNMIYMPGGPHVLKRAVNGSVAISLDMAIRDKVGLTAIAGGYSAGAIVFEY